MRKDIILLSFFSLVLLISQVHIGHALQKTYDWVILRDDIAYNKYKISLETSDSWQVGTLVNVTFRLTLTYKIYMFNHTETNWVKILLRSEDFQMDSGERMEKVTLSNVGDYWEHKVSFFIREEQVNRGQTLKVSIAFRTSIIEIDNIQWRRWEQIYVWGYANPLYVNLFRPALSTSDLGIVAAAIIAMSGISGFAFYRKIHRKRRPTKPSLTEIMKEIEQARKPETKRKD